VKSGELSLSFTAYRINQHREYSPLGSTRDLAQSYGNSDNDTRHVAVINYIWELPLGRGKGYLSNGVVGKIMEGFELGGIFTAQTGHPFQVRGTLDTQRTGITAWGYQFGDPFGSGTACGLTPAPGSGYAYFSNECPFTNRPTDSLRTMSATTGMGRDSGIGM